MKYLSDTIAFRLKKQDFSIGSSIVPERHASGTNLSFVDCHSEYWKWGDERTRKFALEAMELDNPNDATYWRRLEVDNEDIRKLVTAVWGDVGW